MASIVRHVTFDCRSPYELARFWSEVTGHPMADDDEPEDDECSVEVPAPGAVLLFVRVPDGKTVKNRVHVDLQPTDRTREEEVERLLALGATLVDDLRKPNGKGWAVLADPEGNEFCVERSAAERAASSDDDGEESSAA